jgi:hypothetical protein
MKIAFLACPGTLPGSPTRRFDAFEHNLLFAALDAGLAGRAQMTAIDWRAPIEQLAGYDLAYLGTPWDYTEAKDAFLDRLQALEAAGVVVCNSAAVVRWNADKFYLEELARRGAATIPTLWPEAPDEAARYASPSTISIASGWWSSAGSAPGQSGRSASTGTIRRCGAGGWTSRR